MACVERHVERVHISSQRQLVLTNPLRRHVLRLADEPE